jgi:hypothetical protein
MPLSHTPVSEVELWRFAVVLVQRTLLPTFTVTSAGKNSKFMIVTSTKLGGTHVGVGGATVLVRVLVGIAVFVRVEVGGTAVVVGVAVGCGHVFGPTTLGTSWM